MSLSKNIRHAVSILSKPGDLPTVVSRIRTKYQDKKDFAKWVAKYGTLDERAREKIQRAVEKLAYRPLISVVMPVYDIDEKWLRLTVESVRRQLYSNWEFCIADDCSPSPHIRRVLNEFAGKDDKIKVIFRNENGHISAASNSALALATGAFAVLLDHDDELSEDALYCVANELNEFPETEMIYSDEDTIDDKGRRFFPRFKPDFARDLFYSINLITHLSGYKTSRLREVGGFRVGFEGSQDYDLALRVIERIPEDHIRHIPRILYHWRAIRTSAAHSSAAKPYAYQRAREALREHLERAGVKARVEPAVLNLNRVRYELPEQTPKVSLIVFGDQRETETEDRFRTATSYPDLEVLTVPFSAASVLNEAAAESVGEMLCFIDGRFRPLSLDWLTELVALAMQEKIGVVGAKLLDADGNIVSAGSIIGLNETIGTAHHKLPREEHGNFVRAQLIGNYSAVSASCMAVRRELFETARGFDAANLEHQFFAADLCLRLRKAGYRIVYTPYAELIRSRNGESSEAYRVDAEELEYFREKWRLEIEYDPFYNPNFALQAPAFTIKT